MKFNFSLSSIWLEISINWHTTSQGPKKKSIQITKRRIDPCPAHTTRNKGSFTTMALWIVQRFLSSTVRLVSCPPCVNPQIPHPLEDSPPGHMLTVLIFIRFWGSPTKSNGLLFICDEAYRKVFDGQIKPWLPGFWKKVENNLFSPSRTYYDMIFLIITASSIFHQCK